MAKSKKEELTTDEAKLATKMINEKVSLGRVARYFGKNKPTILKGIGIWNTGIRKMADGREYKMVRGRVIFIGKGAFEIKDLPKT